MKFFYDCDGIASRYEENTKNQLIKEECPAMLLVIFNFVFLPMIQHSMQNLDGKFQSKSGPKAYPRTLLLIMVLYCFSENINKYNSIAEECKKNKFLILILEGKTPTRGTFANFLNNSDHEIAHRVFVSTLTILNEMKALSIARVFIDSTDIIIRGSKHYYIKQRDLKAMNLLNKWNLLHDDSPEKINKTLKELKYKIKRI